MRLGEREIEGGRGTGRPRLSGGDTPASRRCVVPCSLSSEAGLNVAFRHAAWSYQTVWAAANAVAASPSTATAPRDSSSVKLAVAFGDVEITFELTWAVHCVAGDPGTTWK